jgi:hypothetical protein
VASEDVEVDALDLGVWIGVGGRRESGRAIQGVSIGILLALNDDYSRKKMMVMRYLARRAICLMNKAEMMLGLSDNRPKCSLIK